MAKFTIIVTRETTESTVLELDAADSEEAEELALQRAGADYGSGVNWTFDESSGMQSEPYVTNCEEA